MICNHLGFDSGALKINGIRKNLERVRIFRIFNLICPQNVSLLKECKLEKSGLLKM